MAKKYTIKEEKKFKRYYLNIARTFFSAQDGKYQKTCELLDKALADGFPIDYIPSRWDGLEYKTLLFQIANVKPYDAKDRDVIEKIALHLIDRGADVNDTVPTGANFLMFVCAWAHLWTTPAFFEEVVKKTSNVNLLINEEIPAKLTPFSAMAEVTIETLLDEMRSEKLKQEYFRKLQILLDAGADPYLAPRWTDPLTSAASGYSTEEIEPAIAKIKQFIETYQEQKLQLNNNTAVWCDYEI